MSLHEGEPCTSCGLRFRDDQRDEYQAHLDWHYHENRLDKDGTRATMRNWFLHPDVSNNNNDNNPAFEISGLWQVGFLKLIVALICLPAYLMFIMYMYMCIIKTIFCDFVS